MVQIGPPLDELVLRLRVAGFAADTDPGALDVHPAAIWVQPRQVLDDRQTLRVWLYLIVPGTDTARVITLLDDALEGVLELLDPIHDDDAFDLAAAVILPSSPVPLPAYRLAVDLDL